MEKEIEKTYVIGIAGASASGKSTVSERLKQLLAEYEDDNHPMALDLDRCYLDVQKVIKTCDILIVEGLFAFWEKRIFSLLDLKVYVDCDADERFARRVKRNLSFGQSLEEITGRYVQAVQPRQRAYVEPAKWKADILLNGFSQVAIGVEIVAEWVRGRR